MAPQKHTPKTTLNTPSLYQPKDPKTKNTRKKITRSLAIEGTGPSQPSLLIVGKKSQNESIDHWKEEAKQTKFGDKTIQTDLPMVEPCQSQWSP